MSELNFKKLAKEMSGTQRSGSSVLLLSVVTLIGIIIFWSAVTELDHVVRGSGKTISEAQNQFVQAAEPGVLSTRYVREGDFVKKGQLLFDIDPIDAKAVLDQVQKRYQSLTIKSTRLKAEIENQTPDFSQDMIAPDTVSTELALYKARIDDLNTKSAILEQRRIQKLNEIQELKIQFDTAMNGLSSFARK